MKIMIMAGIAVVAYGALGEVQTELKPGDVTLRGYVGERLDGCIRNNLLATDVSYLTDWFRWRTERNWWHAEFWGKFMHGAVPLAEYSRNAALKAKFTVGEYKFTVYVDQPGAGGSRATYQLSPFDVGHAFWKIECVHPQLQELFEGYVDLINVSMGFYPVNSPPNKTQDETGYLAIPDCDHIPDVTRSWFITQSAFRSAVLFSYSFRIRCVLGTVRYNLSSYNCADAVLDAAETAGILIPRTEGTWPGGSGHNPGDLGEDIRSMP